MAKGARRRALGIAANAMGKTGRTPSMRQAPTRLGQQGDPGIPAESGARPLASAMSDRRRTGTAPQVDPFQPDPYRADSYLADPGPEARYEQREPVPPPGTLHPIAQQPPSVEAEPFLVAEGIVPDGSPYSPPEAFPLPAADTGAGSSVPAAYLPAMPSQEPFPLAPAPEAFPLPEGPTPQDEAFPISGGFPLPEAEPVAPSYIDLSEDSPLPGVVSPPEHRGGTQTGV
jgi:hypothetical protein